ncbi:UDP-3-O-[3-hydroxymyristoyl] N-acetylglucosamine deacetylase [hydrothermal vent metagenome]|uniref:UDP-3-O-acyl-N-acetylglucosamine deacetylase n=1 Tax=hydrothermal vent metagenome TaxID=652676 RepID=A0A3B0QL67_9ZZZZ
MFQRTVDKIVEFEGLGLHTGTRSSVKILPAGAGEGITFVRTDIPGAPRIKAAHKNLVSTSFATTIGKDGVTVGTVEHILAALYGLGVDNAVIELDGQEIPIMDGSAMPIVDLIEAAGLRKLDATRKYLVIEKPIRVIDHDRFVYFMPASKNEQEDGLSVDYTIDFAQPYLENQSFSFSFTRKAFKKELASARTFGYLKDVEMLKKNGLAHGASLDNAVVIGDEDILNEEGLRFHDEFVRHKVLDLLGDLALLGVPVVGKLQAFRAGHGLNQKLVGKVLETPSSWKRLELVEDDFPKIFPAYRKDLLLG